MEKFKKNTKVSPFSFRRGQPTLTHLINMNIFVQFFHFTLYQPLLNALILLYQCLPGQDFGIAIIVLTALIRLIFSPLMTYSLKSQKALSDLQPELQEIQKKYQNDRERQGRETMELYRQAKINPFSGCLPILVQLPILFALFQVFGKGLQPEALNSLYSFVPAPQSIDPTFLGWLNLNQPSLGLAFLAGLTQFFQTKMISSKSKKTEKKDGKMFQLSGLVEKQTLYFFPVLTFFILFKLPGAVGLYWLVTNLVSIFQQHLIFKKNPSKI